MTLIFVLSAASFALWAALAIVFAIYLFDVAQLKLGSYAFDEGGIYGYAPKFSFAGGESVPLFIHAKEALRLRLYRLGADWEDTGKTFEIPAHRQKTRYSPTGGLSWQQTLAIDTNDLAPGLYRFTLERKTDPRQRFCIPVIIREKTPQALYVVLSTNTWEAYNPFAGISHYENRHPRIISRAFARLIGRPPWAPDYLAFPRPNVLFADEAAKSPFGAEYHSFTVRNELEFLVFLARNGFAFGIGCDDDLPVDPAIDSAKALVIPGHAEYWTSAMIYRIERFIARGGKVYFSNSGLEGVCITSPQGHRYRWRGNENVQTTITGTHGTGEGDFTAAPYRILDPDHWVFEGTGLKAGDAFGIDCANLPSVYAIGHEHLLRRADLSGQPGRGASGFFTARTGFGSGPFDILAVGANPVGPAHMVFRRTAEGGWVFNASSHCFNGSLFHDAAVARIVLNLMKDARGGAS